jgi:hypothetical protein
MYTNEESAIIYNKKHNTGLLRAFHYLCVTMVAFSIIFYCACIIWYFYFEEGCATRYQCHMPPIESLFFEYFALNPYMLAVPFAIPVPFLTTIKRSHFIVLCVIVVIGVCWGSFLWWALAQYEFPEYHAP